MPASIQRATVVGAGIGGLITALTLQKAGIKVRVLEQACELGEIGAGLTLQRNANRVLAALGLLDHVDQHASLPEYGAFKHLTDGAHVRDVGPYRYTETRPDGRSLDIGFRQIHRADFHAVLVAAVRSNDADAILTDHRVSACHQDNNSATIDCANGASITADAVLGCDGVRSVVRQSLLGKEDREFLHFIAWRGLVDIARLPAGLIEPTTAAFIGDGKSFVRYLVRGGSVVNFAGFAKVDEWTDEGWNTPATKAEIAARYADANDEIRMIIDAAPDEGLFKWGLFGCEPLTTWSEGRITLVGDAAHPMLPFLGQGAAMAIEDGYTLGRALATYPTVAEAFARYEALRVERTTLTLYGSRFAGLKMHGVHDAATESAAQGYTEEFVGDYDPVAIAV